MTPRRALLLLAGLMLAAPALWAAVRHVRQELTFDVVRLAATAHERVSYEGRASWRGGRWSWWPPCWSSD